MIPIIKDLAASFSKDLIAIRRHLHQHPELSFQEYNTSEFIQKELTKLDIPFKTGYATTGIVAHIYGNNPDKNCIALRADMDALPIEERNTVDYASKNKGVMHACGHDVHTTCLLGAAKILNELKHQFEGTIKLIFQPGEELSPGGASIMIAEGALALPKPNAIIGLHVFPELPAGFVGFREGQYMASADEIYITVKGKGGHAALPHKTIDPIVIASQIVISLQQIVSRKSNPITPSVLSFGKINGGFANNVIPDSVAIEGTFRTFDETWRKEALRLIKEVSEQTAAAYGATVDVHIPLGYPSLFNAPQLTRSMKNAAQKFVGTEHVIDLDMRLTGEDFSFYTQHMDGCFFRLGTNKDNDKYMDPVHTATFNIDESALEIGAGMMAHLGLIALQQ